ncbi:MAG TPA: cation transporter [Stellaceae bacterium]|nr:cation transporter [Stellaceae bacterium]
MADPGDPRLAERLRLGRLRRVAALVASLNFAYFGVEFAVALAIGSVALFADSVDFLEDTAVNLLIVLALGWTPRARAAVGAGLGALLLAPGIATLITAWHKFGHPSPPAAIPLSLTGLGAFAVNLGCAMLLARWRGAGGSLSRAAFLSARNDAIANVAIVVAGVLTAATASIWPDLVVGLAIFLINLDAAREVWTAAHREYRGTALRP